MLKKIPIYKDIKGYLFNKFFYQLFLLILSFFFKPYLYFICYLKGVTLGVNNNFWGKTIFYRAPGSKIKIGSYCSFRSLSSSNLIGIKQKCMISTITSEAELIIGSNCGFSGTVIGAFKSVIIKDGVRCGANTLITDSDWHLDDKRSGLPSPVLIEQDVWLGEGVKILKGVTIGKNSIIGAGSVVTKDIPANVIAAGNPCKEIKVINVKD